MNVSERAAIRLIWGALALGLIGFAPFVPANHDESQYLAAAVLTRSGLPFIDYLYLQTPLQPFFTAPIAALFSGYSFIALRIATAVAGLATLWFVFGCQRQLGVNERTALAATTLLALTHTFLFGATVVRNDILPALLLAGGMYAALAAMAGRRPVLLWMVAGLAFGAAVGTKVSYALPAIGVGVFLLVDVLRRRDRVSVILASACALGALISFVPLALLYAKAPAAFIYGVIDFGAEAPFQWYRLKGHGHRLGIDWKLIDTTAILLRGPACVALVVVASTAFRRGKRDGPHLLLDLLVITGLAAALLPTPTWKQYLMPLLPPLFVRLGFAWQEGVVAGRWRRITIRAFALSALVGLAQPVLWGWWLVAGSANSVTMTREAHWIGERLRAAGARGSIATLTPQVTLDSGFALDPRFAPGPFAYRSGDMLSDEEQRTFLIVSPRTLDRFLAERPPAALVTGYEVDRTNLEGGLRAFAWRNGYRRVHSPFGKAELFIRPAKASPIRAHYSSSSSTTTDSPPLAGK